MGLLRLRKSRCVTVISLKKIYVSSDGLYTYGGFGKYLDLLLEVFEYVVLVSPVVNQPLEGQYRLSERITHVGLKSYGNELDQILKSIINWPKIFGAVSSAEVVNPRIPDLTGALGLLFAKLLRKPHFVSIQSDIEEMVERGNFTKRNFFIKALLRIWFRIYIKIENRLCKNSVLIPQGKGLEIRFGAGLKENIFPWVSTALRRNDILSQMHPRLSRPERAVGKRAVIMVGRNVNQKNQIEGIRAFSKVSDGQRLLVVGKNSCLHDPMLVGAANVSTSAPLQHDRLLSMFLEFDFLLLSSLWEGTPKVVVEAMANGLVPVVTPTKGLRGVVVDGQTGLVANGFTRSDIASVLRRAFDMDDNELIRLRRNCVDASMNYCLERQVDYYKNIVARARSV